MLQNTKTFNFVTNVIFEIILFEYYLFRRFLTDLCLGALKFKLYFRKIDVLKISSCNMII